MTSCFHQWQNSFIRCLSPAYADAPCPHFFPQSNNISNAGLSILLSQPANWYVSGLDHQVVRAFSYWGHLFTIWRCPHAKLRRLGSEG